MKIIKNNYPLCKAEFKEVAETNEYLKENQFQITDIRENPTILLSNKSTIENRSKILRECSFQDVKIMFLARYVFVMNRNINILKAYNYIDPSTNVARNLQNFLQLNSTLKEDLGDSVILNDLRISVLNLYLKEHFDCNNQQITKLWKTYPRLKHRSFEYITATVDILRNHLNFSNERIINNGYLLYADPHNIIDILNYIPTIAGHDVREILMRRPKIMMSNWESIEKIIKYIKQSGIPEKAIAKCLEVLTLGPDTIMERLMDLKKVDEFSVLCNHPRVLRLVHYQNKAMTRLNYLQQLKVKCASLHILSASSDTFEKWVLFGF